MCAVIRTQYMSAIKRQLGYRQGGLDGSIEAGPESGSQFDRRLGRSSRRNRRSGRTAEVWLRRMSRRIQGPTDRESGDGDSAAEGSCRLSASGRRIKPDVFPALRLLTCPLRTQLGSVANERHWPRTCRRVAVCNGSCTLLPVRQQLTGRRASSECRECEFASLAN